MKIMALFLSVLMSGSNLFSEYIGLIVRVYFSMAIVIISTTQELVGKFTSKFTALSKLVYYDCNRGGRYKCIESENCTERFITMI